MPQEERGELEKIVLRLKELYNGNKRLCAKLVAADRKSAGQEKLTFKLSEQLRRVNREMGEKSDQLSGAQLLLSASRNRQV